MKKTRECYQFRLGLRLRSELGLLLLGLWLASSTSYSGNIILRFSIVKALFITWVLGWQLQRRNFGTMTSWFDVKHLTAPERCIVCPPVCLVVLFVIVPFGKNKDNNNRLFLLSLIFMPAALCRLA